MSISKRIALFVIAAMACALALGALAVFLLGAQSPSAWQLFAGLAAAQLLPCAALLLLLVKLRPLALAPAASQ